MATRSDRATQIKASFAQRYGHLGTDVQEEFYLLYTQVMASEDDNAAKDNHILLLTQALQRMDSDLKESEAKLRVAVQEASPESAATAPPPPPPAATGGDGGVGEEELAALRAQVEQLTAARDALRDELAAARAEAASEAAASAAQLASVTAERDALAGEVAALKQQVSAQQQQLVAQKQAAAADEPTEEATEPAEETTEPAEETTEQDTATAEETTEQDTATAEEKQDTATAEETTEQDTAEAEATPAEEAAVEDDAEFFDAEGGTTPAAWSVAGDVAVGGVLSVTPAPDAADEVEWLIDGAVAATGAAWTVPGGAAGKEIGVRVGGAEALAQGKAALGTELIKRVGGMFAGGAAQFDVHVDGEARTLMLSKKKIKLRGGAAPALERTWEGFSLDSSPAGCGVQLVWGGDESVAAECGAADDKCALEAVVAFREFYNNRAGFEALFA